MIGIIIQLLISWAIIWFVEKENLRVLGLMPSRKRLQCYILFFLVTALCCSSGFLMRMLFLQQRWVLNPDMSVQLLLEGAWWNLKSVLFEELIFRGVLLYILVKRTGQVKGILISSIAFGIYHWFSQEAFGNPVQMAWLFFITGAMGLVYAYGYVKTMSIYVPVSMHLGWNLTSSVIFSQTTIGKQLFVPVLPVPEVEIVYALHLAIQLIPIAAAILVNFFMLKRLPKSAQSESTISP